MLSLMVSPWALGRGGLDVVTLRLSRLYLGTVRCRKLILGRDIAWLCRCAMSWCDLDLTFDLAVITLTYKILYGLCLGNGKV